MPSVRRLALGLGALLACLLLLLILLPVLFRDRITTSLKTAVAKSVDAQVTWGDVGLSFLRDFPHVSVSVDRLAVVGLQPFAGDTLVTMRRARLVLDVASVVRYLRRGAPIVVREIVLSEPAANLRVLDDGRANWDIARRSASAGTTSGSGVSVTLRHFRVDDGSLVLDDRHSRMAASVRGLQESLSGDFASKRFVLATRTHADTVSLRFGGVPYLNRVGVDLNANIDADLPAHRFTVRNDSLRLNALVLAFGGSVTTGAPNTTLDVAFSAPSTAFRDILSLVPAIYARDFASLQTSGSMSMSGQVRGALGPHAFPAFALRAHVRDGMFHYPSLPLPATGIAMDLAVDNPGGQVDSTVVNLRAFHAVIGGRPLDASLVLRTPVSDPDVNLRLTGGVNLADLARTVELQGVSGLRGQLAANLAVHARVSDVDAHRYDRVDAHGGIDAAGVALQSTTLARAIAIDTAALRLTPRTTELAAFAARIGGSDVRATGSLDNLLGFVFRNDDLRGTADVSSRRFVLDEWRSKQKSSDVIPVPPRVDFTLKAAADTVTYGALAMTNVHGNLHVHDQRVTLDGLSMDMLHGTILANGFYDTHAPDHPAFDAAVRLTTVDIPAAFAALTTVQKLAPMARWASGHVSGTLALGGALGRDMVPRFSTLAGKGDIQTGPLAMGGAPLFAKLADSFRLEQLRNPSLAGVRAAFDIADGRVRVKPFSVGVNGVNLTISGSHGFDQSLAYDIGVAVPRTALGGAASGIVERLASQAGVGSATVAGAPVVQLGARVGGTVTNPTVNPRFAGSASSVQEAARNAIRQAGTARLDSAKARADSAAAVARARARARADSIVAAAERQAADIRANARALAATAQKEAKARADSLVARASNPIARVAAQAAAQRLTRESDQQGARMVREADARADSLVARARVTANALVPPAK